MKISRRFTKSGQDALASVDYEKRTSRITNPDGSVVFEMTDAEIPKQWSQLATDIMVSKYFRKAGVPQPDGTMGPEKSAKQVVHRLAGCWRHWGESHGYFDTAEDAQAFYDELAYMLLHQMCAPNSPQWFNTGLHWAYNITGPAQGHHYCDPKTGQLKQSSNAYEHPQPHACFIQSVADDLVNPGGIMDLWTREARLFKYGSGTGSNFSKLRGENEKLSGGGKSSGLMSFLKIGDRAAGAIKSGGTTRRAAKMVCLDLDHPDVEDFINWKVREELKVAALAEGMKVLPKDQQELAKKLGLKLDYDFNGEAYMTVSGQNSNNSVRIPNSFFKSLEEDGDWNLTSRTKGGKVVKTLKARELWEEISYAAWRCADPGVQYDGTINDWHTCPASGRINASNPCVTGDTRVLTPGGIWRRIDQMIHLPARIVTNLDGQQVHVVDGAFPTGTKEVFELRTQGGYSLKLTGDHKVWTRTRGWQMARDLTDSDEIKLPSQPASVQQIGEPQDHKLFQLVGLFLGSANADHSAIQLDRVVAPEQIDEFTQYVHRTWGERAYDDDYVNKAMIDGDDSVRPASAGQSSGNTITASLTNRRLLSRLRAFVKIENGQKRLSDDAFTAGLAAQKHLLRALFTVDGRITHNSLELLSTSPGLLQDVQLILLGFGVKSSIFSNDIIDFPKTATSFGRAPIAADAPNGAVVLAGMDPIPSRPNGSTDAADRGDYVSARGGSSSAQSERLSYLPSLPHQATGSRAENLGASVDLIDGSTSYAASRRHGLRIDAASLRSFGKHVALLPGKKLAALADVISLAISTGSDREALLHGAGNYDRVASLTPQGLQQVFDLTEPVTHSFVANGLTVHNCSEYMFLDDTACNLASLNVLTFFDSETGRFDLDAFKHGTRIWTIVLEISVLMASFPSEEIAKLSYRYRTLGLGYANLGAMLMQAGIPYDSDKGRAICAAITAILTGESYATSAEMAKELGAFAGYLENRESMLRVIRNHRRAAYDVPRDQYEQLEIKPIAIDETQFVSSDRLCNTTLLATARECWDRALHLGQQHGYRNAQTTVIAPTGTIGLLMDCDTTGVEPDFALVKFKKLAGGGYFKIANQSLRPALVNLGYTAEQIHDILKYVLGTLTLDDAPKINRQRLIELGFTRDELDKIEQSLPGQFELGFAFSAWSLSPETFKRLNISENEWQAPGFNLLKKLGFTAKQIGDASAVICGRGTIEGAPHLKDAHLPVFDCANKCGKLGQRYIHYTGHIKMMAAAQPFLSGAISKTINLPNEATLDEIKSAYKLSWELGLKANALYRDGSKLSQPLNIKSDDDLDKKTDEEDQEAVDAAREEVASQVAQAVGSLPEPRTLNPEPNVEPAHTNIIEKIVERIVERPLRRRLPDTRNALTHKFDISGHEGYITVGLYEDGQPGEVFITMAKEGSTIGGLMDCIATLVSVSLQYGVPVDSLVRKFEHVRFEPSGMTRNQEIPFAKSLVDYIFRWLAMEFIPGYRAAHAPQRPKKAEAAPAPITPAAERSAAPDSKTGNGHSRLEEGAKPFDYGSGSGLENKISEPVAKSDDAAAPSYGSNLRLQIVADPLSQQGSEMQADAPACDVCGSITVRSGTCYKCLNCGNSMGCS